MISSQKRDGVFTFNMHSNPLLSIIVDNNWRKESLKDVEIFIPNHGKFNTDLMDQADVLGKFPASEKVKEWNDLGLMDMLGKYTGLKDENKKDKDHADFR